MLSRQDRLNGYINKGYFEYTDGGRIFYTDKSDDYLQNDEFFSDVLGFDPVIHVSLHGDKSREVLQVLSRIITNRNSLAESLGIKLPEMYITSPTKNVEEVKENKKKVKKDE